jgi:hypothetical protein
MVLETPVEGLTINLPIQGDRFMHPALPRAAARIALSRSAEALTSAVILAARTAGAMADQLYSTQTSGRVASASTSDLSVDGSERCPACGAPCPAESFPCQIYGGVACRSRVGMARRRGAVRDTAVAG